MGTLYISEFPAGARHGMQVEQQPSLVDQVVTIGAGSLQSAAFSGDTKMVELHADAICSIRFGSNPSATAANMRMVAGQVKFCIVNPGDKVAVIQNT